MLKTISEWTKLFRIEHGLMLSIATYIGLKIASYKGDLLIPLLIPLFIEMGAFALNDYFDIKTDKENKRFERPLVKGTIKKEHAFFAGIFFLVFGSFLSYFININAFLFSIFLAFTSYLYSYKIKDIALIGNMFIAFTMSAPFIFPYFITGSFQYFNFLLSLSAFFTGLSREIVKTVQDFDADLKQRKSKTLPFYIGKKNSIKLALLIFVISVFFLFFILFELIKLKVSLISYFLISISFTLCGYSIRLMFKFQDLEAIRKATLLAMAFFLVALAIAF